MWITFSILAAFIWAVVNIVDKYILTRWVRNPLIPVMILVTIGLMASIIVYFTYGFSYLSYFNIFLALIAGIFYLLMAIFYFKAVKIEEISRVSPLFYLSPLFILIFATIFLGEIFTLLKYLGIFLLMAGAILISSRDISKISLGRAFWWMILSTIAFALNQILTKYLLNSTDYWTIFAWTRIGAGIGLIPIAYIYFPELIETARKQGKRVIVIILANETFNLLGVLSITIAVSIGYVTLVNALSSIQPFFVLLFAVILSIFYPSILKEEIGKSVIFLNS
ncbi:MAG: EamA family transporter [Patescibacteria group bacterium]|nr:EamA family transporter [Patescibacteria group bacterium]